MIIQEATAGLPEKIPVKIIFEDEAGFGRLSDQRRCWALMWERPIVGRQVIREFVYAIAAALQPGTQSGRAYMGLFAGKLFRK